MELYVTGRTLMKNAVLVYNSYDGYFNIGDYIQSLAARQFLIEPVEFLNREQLNEYSGDKLKLIMNGWFTHDPDNWPPSKDVVSHFVSFHINSVAKDLMLSEQGVDYLKLW